MKTNCVDNGIVTSYIGLGSNIGDRAGNLLLAVRGLIEASLCVTKLSAIYETAPVDIETTEPFLNMVAEIRSENVSPSQLMARLLRIEYLLGRTDKSLKKPRTIDLDILFFGNAVVDSAFVTIPHPRLHLRRFVLMPLAEIAPDFIHPQIHRPVKSLLTDLGDTQHVVRWHPNRLTGSSPEPLDLQGVNDYSK